MSRPRPSEGTEPTIVLQIAPTGNSDNAFRLGPIVAVFSPCEQEAGFIFSLLLLLLFLSNAAVFVGLSFL